VISDLQFDEFEEQNYVMIKDESAKLQIQDYLVISIDNGLPSDPTSVSLKIQKNQF
jgi:hypothetical protein